MSNISWPFSFVRLDRAPLDASYVFANTAAFTTYLSSGPAYAGQIVAVRQATGNPAVYQINEGPPFTYSPLSGEMDPNEVSVGTAGPPPSPEPGALWTTIDGKLFVWASGGYWVQIGG